MHGLSKLMLLAMAVGILLGWSLSPAVAQSSSSGSSAESADRILLPVNSAPKPIPTSHHLDIENYASGAVKLRREINLLSDESAINHGQYTEFYENGEKFAEGRFDNGAREGEWTYWHENGTKCKTVHYRGGAPHGEWTVYRDDGTRRAVRNYENGEPQGTWRIFAEDGETVLKEETYQDGLAHGKWVRRFASGKPHIEEEYQSGKRHGKYVEYDEQGQVVREMQFKDGRIDGRVLIRSQDGREIIQQYRDGQFLLDGSDTGGQ